MCRIEGRASKFDFSIEFVQRLVFVPWIPTTSLVGLIGGCAAGLRGCPFAEIRFCSVGGAVGLLS